MFVMLVNPKVLLHLDSNVGNVVLKLLIILTGLAFMATRPVHRGVVMLICAIVMLTFACAVGTDYPGFQWRLYAGGVVSIVAPFILMTAQPNEGDRRLILSVFAALPVLMTLLGALYQVAGIGALYTSDAESGTRLGGSQGIAAYLAGAAFIGSFAALELAERRHLAYAALLFLDIVILVLAGGRMALAATIFVCGLDFLRSFKRVPLLRFFVTIWFVGCAAITFLLLRESVLRHLTSTSLSNRDLIWAALQRHLDAHPWFGVGLGSQQLLVSKGLLGKVATFAGHNEYMRIGVELGYPGAILFFLLSLAICFLVWNSAWVRRDPMFLVCVVACYLYALTDNTFSVPQIYFILTAASFAGRGENAPSVEGTRRYAHEKPVEVPP